MLYYAIPNKSDQFCGPEHLMPAGAILMQYERPTLDAIAKPDGTWFVPPQPTPDPAPVVLSSDGITVADADVLLAAAKETGTAGGPTAGALLAQWLIAKMEL